MSNTETSETATTSIAPATGVGAVHLGVTDAERAKRFYTDVMGLTPLGTGGDALIFGSSADKELVVPHPGAKQPVVEGTTGLYHLAVVVPSRRELAR